MFAISGEAITLFGFSIRLYGVMIALGVFLGAVLMIARERKLGLQKDTAIDVALWVIPCAIVCARLYYVAFRLDIYIAAPLSIFNLRQGGMAIYGGVLGGVLAGCVYARVKRAPFLRLADLAAPALALGQAVGRWGNFFNQEAYGPMVQNAAYQFFPNAVYIDAQAGWYMATFFYESLWCALLCALILIFERRGAFSRPGDAALAYSFGYAAERAVVEGLRADSLYLGSVRVSQALSVTVLCALAISLCLSIKDAKRRRVSVILACLVSCPLALGALNVFTPGTLLNLILCALALALCAYAYCVPSRAPASSFRLRK